jgi:hypothetical protein
MNLTEMSFEDLMEEAYDLPGEKAKLELLEQAVRVADAAGDLDQGYEARSEIVETGSFHGYPMKALVAFSWQLGQYDKTRAGLMITACCGPTSGFWTASPLLRILAVSRLRTCWKT